MKWLDTKDGNSIAVFPAAGRTLPEDEEQMQFFRWIQYARGTYPALDLFFHIPNGGRRSKAEAGRFKAMGVRSGVPDLCLPVARRGYHGLWIELKAAGGRPSSEQKKWLGALIDQGYYCAICYGWDAARKVAEWYLGEEA